MDQLVIDNNLAIQEHVVLQIPDDDGPRRRTAINTSKIEYVELNANPILGCSHRCRYCYARKIDLRFGKVKSEDQWHEPRAFVNYFEVLERELSRGKVDRNKEIFMSTMTDLYQPYAIKNGIGRKLIGMIQNYGGAYRILTKSQRVTEDKDLLVYPKGKVGLSITTDQNNEKIRKYWEPKTVSIKRRLQALKELADHGGILLWVSAEPFLPGTDFRKYYQDIIEAGGSSLQEIIIGKMNYESGIDQQFDWQEVVEISEEFRLKYKNLIRFHYKREFWNFLIKKQLTPVHLELADATDFCFPSEIQS